MDKKLTSMKQPFVVVLVFLNVFLFCAYSNKIKVVRFRTISGLYNTDFRAVFHDVSRVRCSEQCATTDGCVLVNYNKATNACQLAPSTSYAMSDFVPDSAWDIIYDRSDEDVCASSPCLNGGTCVGGINSYTCACTPSWKGGQCETIICPTGYSHITDISCYEIYSNTELDYFAASNYCNSNAGGHLVDTATQEEVSLVKSLLIGAGNNKDFWIGLNDIHELEVYRWSDGSLVSSEFTNWIPGQPDHWTVNEKCVELNLEHDFLWNDSDCYFTKAFICEYP